MDNIKPKTKEEWDKKWPMSKIPDCIREVAVAWAGHLFIQDTVKLAQDMLDATEKNTEQMSIGFAEWLTRNDSPYAILYGEEQRWCDNDREYTTPELFTLYKQTLK